MAVSAQDNRVQLNDDHLSYVHGVLCVEIKEASKIYEQAQQERLYVIVTIGQAVKKTQSVQRVYGLACWATTKHFPVRVDPNKKHKDNLVEVTVVCANNHPDDFQPDRTVGAVWFHMHDVIKQSPVDGVFDLFNQYQTVGEIKLALSFSYGIFGYGYSPQLNFETPTQAVPHFLSHSLFPRIDPVVARLDSPKHVLIPKATRHPLFIPFNQRIQLGFGQEIATTLDNLQDTSGKFSLLGGDMGRLNALQDQLKCETSRANRLAFLSTLLLDNNKKSEAIKEGLEEVHLKHDPSTTHNTNSVGNLVILSHEEMKERGLLVISLPKEQEKEKPPNTASTSVLLDSSSSDNASTSASSNMVANPSTSTAHNKGTRPASGSFRSNLPPPTHAGLLDALNNNTNNLSSTPPHSPSMSTPLLGHPSPLSSHTQSSMKLPTESPTNPYIQRLKLNL